MKLTDHFTLEELTRSVSHPEINNKPDATIIANLLKLCKLILEPTRVMLGQPIIITSGYRCKLLNDKVGGVANSYHLRGLAADIRITNNQTAQTILDIFALNTNVDVALFEHSHLATWLHVQMSTKPRHIINRHYIAT